MKSELPKVLHRIAGKALIDRVLETAQALGPSTITMVVGHGAEKVQERTSLIEPGVAFVVQEPQLGTGHALLQTEPLLRGRTGTVILLSGDVPLLTANTLRALVATHHEAGAAATVLTAKFERPYGYGRIVRTNGRIARIVEERDATPAQREIREINSGIYAFAARAAVRRARRDRLRRTRKASITSRSHWHLPSPEARRGDVHSRAAQWRFAASTAEPNLLRSAKWCDSRRTKS